MKNARLPLLWLVLTLVIAVFMTGPGLVQAETIKLKGISFLDMTTEHAKMFEEFTNRVNAKAGGKLEITCLGGPEVISANEQIQALKTGMVDMAIAPIAYQSKLVPESLLWTLTLDTPWEERESGFFDLMAGFYEKANMHLLGSTARGATMYFFLDKEIKRPQDLNGMKIRTTSSISNLLNRLGCKGVTVPRADLYVAMERGLIDGFLSPTDTLLSLGQQEVCKYFVDHGFLVSVITYVVNQKTWEKLPPDMQELMTQTMIEMEREYYPKFFQTDEDAKKKIIELGVKRIKFSPEDAKFFMKTVYECYSEDVDKATPENAEKMRALIKHRVGD